MHSDVRGRGGKSVADGPILIIDDDRELCDLVSSTLVGRGFQVLSAHDGESGLEIARQARPAAILLDMLMPDLDGIETCRRLKKDRVLGDIPIVAMTASTDLRFTERAFYAGAEFFLPKPFGTESLAHIVRLAADASDRNAPVRLRAHPRYPAGISVRCQAGTDLDAAQELTGETDNVSLGGLLLLLPEAVEPGTIVRLRLDLPEGAITADGAVVWYHTRAAPRERTPHGVRFLRFAGDVDLVQYRQYMDQLTGGRAPTAYA
jgi:CheY-like chemotaxis protein